MKEISIKNKTYKVGFSFRAIREFEKIAGKSITECTTTWDHLLFFYSTLKGVNKDFDMDLEAFTDEMDKHPELLATFQTETTDQPRESIPDMDEKNPQKKSTSQPLFTSWTLFLLLAASPVLLPIIFGTLWIWTSLKLLARLTVKIGKRLGSLFLL